MALKLAESLPAKRIRQARLAAGLSVIELLDKLTQFGVTLTRQSLHNYEIGRRTPDAKTIGAIAKALSVNTSYFYSEQRTTVSWVAFRCQSTLRVKAKDQVKAKAEVLAEKYLFLLNLISPASLCDLPVSKVARIEDVEKCAVDFRNRCSLGLDPIENLTQTLENIGCVICFENMPSVRFDGLSGWANEKWPVIVVNESPAGDRVRFNIAHELGHLLMDIAISPTPKETEQYAHWFACALLAPGDAMRAELGAKRRKLLLAELATLKLKYGISMQALLYRLLNLNIIDRNEHKSLLLSMYSQGWREKEPVQYKGNERPVRLEQMVLRGVAEGVISESTGHEICPSAFKPLFAEPADLPATRVRELMRMPAEERGEILRAQVGQPPKDLSEESLEWAEIGSDDGLE